MSSLPRKLGERIAAAHPLRRRDAGRRAAERKAVDVLAVENQIARRIGYVARPDVVATQRLDRVLEIEFVGEALARAIDDDRVRTLAFHDLRQAKLRLAGIVLGGTWKPSMIARLLRMSAVLAPASQASRQPSPLTARGNGEQPSGTPSNSRASSASPSQPPVARSRRLVRAHMLRPPRMRTPEPCRICRQQTLPPASQERPRPRDAAAAFTKCTISAGPLALMRSWPAVRRPARDPSCCN